MKLVFRQKGWFQHITGTACFKAPFPLYCLARSCPHCQPYCLLQSNTCVCVLEKFLNGCYRCEKNFAHIPNQFKLVVSFINQHFANVRHTTNTYTHCVVRVDAPSFACIACIRLSSLALRRTLDSSSICWSLRRSRSFSAVSATSFRVVSCTA